MPIEDCERRPKKKHDMPDLQEIAKTALEAKLTRDGCVPAVQVFRDYAYARVLAAEPVEYIYQRYTPTVLVAWVDGHSVRLIGRDIEGGGAEEIEECILHAIEGLPPPPEMPALCPVPDCGAMWDGRPHRSLDGRECAGPKPEMYV